jgi:hypothetical protein
VPFAFAAVVVHGTDEYRIVGQELDSLGLAAFVHLDPLLCRIADQDGIELIYCVIFAAKFELRVVIALFFF